MLFTERKHIHTRKKHTQVELLTSNLIDSKPEKRQTTYYFCLNPEFLRLIMLNWKKNVGCSL